MWKVRAWGRRAAVLGGRALGLRAEWPTDVAVPGKCGAELEWLAVAVWRAGPGKPRLAALRRLAAFARRKARRWDKAFAGRRDQPWRGFMGESDDESRFPRDLVRALADCLEESPSEAAPLVLFLFGDLRTCLNTDLSPSADWLLGWQRFFSEASLARLRRLILASEDPLVTKAAIALFYAASVDIVGFQLEEAWATSSEAWAVEGRASLARHQAFLRDPAVLDKLRGLLSGGDPHRLLDPALFAYGYMLGGQPASQPYAVRYWVAFTFGPFHLLRPILHDMVLNFDKLSPVRYGCLLRFFLSPLERPEEAVEAVEGFLLPWLARAEELSPACLSWLVSAIPATDTWYRYYAVPNVPLTPDMEPWASPMGRLLRGQLAGALTDVLKRGRLSDAQLWGFVAYICAFQDPSTGSELFRLLTAAWGRLTVTPQSFLAATMTAFGLSVSWSDEATAGLVVRTGGFRGLVELIREKLSTSKGDWDLQRLLSRAQGLIGWPDQDLGRGEATERLLFWRDAGLGDALRGLLAHHAPSTSLRDSAKNLLDCHDGLLRNHPLPRLSHLPSEIHFPIH